MSNCQFWTDVEKILLEIRTVYFYSILKEFFEKDSRKEIR